MNIIFDMDGTLVDTAKLTMAAFEAICPKYNLEVPSFEVLKSAIGIANPYFYQTIYPVMDQNLRYIFGEEIENIEKVIIETLDINLLFEGVEELLSKLKSDGHVMHIASTGDTDHVNNCLKYTAIKEYFTSIHCNQANKEEMVREIIQTNAYAKWIMVGDKNKDSEAAKYNNIFVIGAGYGYLEKENIKDFNVIIEHPMKLLKVIENYQHKNLSN